MGLTTFKGNQPTLKEAVVAKNYLSEKELRAMEQRQNEDQRTLGERFFFLVDEMADIIFNRSLGTLMASLQFSI